VVTGDGLRRYVREYGNRFCVEEHKAHGDRHYRRWSPFGSRSQIGAAAVIRDSSHHLGCSRGIPFVDLLIRERQAQRRQSKKTKAGTSSLLETVAAERWRQDIEDLKKKDAALIAANQRAVQLQAELRLLEGHAHPQEEGAQRILLEAISKIFDEYRALATDAQLENAERAAALRATEAQLVQPYPQSVTLAPAVANAVANPVAVKIGPVQTIEPESIPSAEAFGEPTILVRGTPEYVANLEQRLRFLEERNRFLEEKIANAVRAVVFTGIGRATLSFKSSGTGESKPPPDQS
jgi:hypothetical protein